VLNILNDEHHDRWQKENKVSETEGKTLEQKVDENRQLQYSIPDIPKWCEKIDNHESWSKTVGSILAWGTLLGVVAGFSHSNTTGILAIVAIVAVWILKLVWQMKTDPHREFERAFPSDSVERKLALIAILQHHRDKNRATGISADTFRQCASLNVYQSFTGGEYQSGQFTIKRPDA
jgi:hypothetical protein